MLINLLHIKKNDLLIFLFVLLFSFAVPKLVCVTAFEHAVYADGTFNLLLPVCHTAGDNFKTIPAHL